MGFQQQIIIVRDAKYLYIIQAVFLLVISLKVTFLHSRFKLIDKLAILINKAL